LNFGYIIKLGSGGGRKKEKRTLSGADESSSNKKTRYQTCLINTWNEWRGKNKIIQHLDVMHNIQNTRNMNK
jgi:hypothetical protein